MVSKLDNIGAVIKRNLYLLIIQLSDKGKCRMLKGCKLQHLVIVLAVILLLLTPMSARTLPQDNQTSQKTPQPKLETGPAWRLRISSSTPATLTLRAVNAPLAEIAAELGRKLKVPVKLSQLMQSQKVTVSFSGLPLEGALRMLAPQVYVDYEIGGESYAQRKIIALYLYGLDEEPPSPSATVKGDSEVILIEGNTEDSDDSSPEKREEKDDKPLRVTYVKNQLSVRALKQPLIVVLNEIANKMDVPFEMQHESHEVVDVDFSNLSVEQAVQSLSPNIRLFVRTDLQTYETRPLRLVLVAPPNTAQTINM